MLIFEIKNVKESSSHYENMPMQYSAISQGCKNDNFQMKKCYIFLIFAQTLIVGTR